MIRVRMTNKINGGPMEVRARGHMPCVTSQYLGMITTSLLLQVKTLLADMAN